MESHIIVNDNGKKNGRTIMALLSLSSILLGRFTIRSYKSTMSRTVGLIYPYHSVWSHWPRELANHTSTKQDSTIRGKNGEKGEDARYSFWEILEVSRAFDSRNVLLTWIPIHTEVVKTNRSVSSLCHYYSPWAIAMVSKAFRWFVMICVYSMLLNKCSSLSIQETAALIEQSH